ncbi:MAG TPA: hypothetical protein VH796_14030 [Nitrososphaeraceae archaeon]
MRSDIQQEENKDDNGNSIQYKTALRNLIFVLVAAALITNSIIIFADSSRKHAFALIELDVTAIVASSLSIIAVWRHKLKGYHGKSYLFLTMGLNSWLCADIVLTYYYFGLGINEHPVASIADAFWFLGYGFLSAHLIMALKAIPVRFDNNKNRVVIIISSIVSVSFLIYSVTRTLTSFEFHGLSDTIPLFVNITYPMLDLILIVPAVLVLVNLRKDYQLSVPWFLTSLSLLVNAIADDGFANDVASGNSHNLLFWDLFFMTDYLIMAAALYWFNRFHISNELRKSNKVKL